MALADDGGEAGEQIGGERRQLPGHRGGGGEFGHASIHRGSGRTPIIPKPRGHGIFRGGADAERLRSGERSPAMMPVVAGQPVIDEAAEDYRSPSWSADRDPCHGEVEQVHDRRWLAILRRIGVTVGDRVRQVVAAARRQRRRRASCAR